MSDTPGVFGGRKDAWHASSAATALEAMSSSREGLDPAEIAGRRALCGPNRLPEAARRGPLLRFLLQFHNVFIYVLLASAVWITVEVLRSADLDAIRNTSGSGGLPFWLAVDLVIVMPVSWLPLAADYNRFARPGSRAALGTYAGYAAGDAWFYAPGVLLVLASAPVASTKSTPSA